MKRTHIKLNQWYSAVDFEGNELSGKFKPFKRLRGFKSSGVWFLCVNAQGGHITIRERELVKIAA